MMTSRRTSTASTGSTMLAELFLAVSQEHERIMREVPNQPPRDTHSPITSSETLSPPSKPGTTTAPKERRPSRGPSLIDQPLVVKKQNKMEGNRQAAQRCRQRKKIYIAALEMRVTELERLNAMIEVELKRIHNSGSSPGAETSE